MARAKGVHVMLGPVAGPLGKIPGAGRGWEGFSPDPYLTGIAMAETIKGMQTAGVQANAKHFIGNEQVCLTSPPFPFPHVNMLICRNSTAQQ
jgi:beta-glucosidase